MKIIFRGAWCQGHHQKIIKNRNRPKLRPPELRLTLHPKKIKLQAARKGFAFLGAYIYPNRICAGRRVAGNFRRCVYSPDSDPEMQSCRVQSYLGLVSHFG